MVRSETTHVDIGLSKVKVPLILSHEAKSEIKVRPAGATVVPSPVPLAELPKVVMAVTR